MKIFLVKLVAGAAAILLAFATASAEAPKSPQSSGSERGPANALPEDSVTHHTIGEGAARLSYTATAGSLPLIDVKGETSAKAFYTAYVLDSKEAGRPVTFIFNGGPGAAAAFLHLGAIGPRAVNFTPNGAAPVSPVQLADNPDSWLAFTDLVFVDPVGTGYSRTTAGTEDAERAFFGAEKDADAMADFVRRYLGRNLRALAPVFLTGESYGGLRAALVANRLLRSGIQVKGMVLLSPVLEYSLLYGDSYALLPDALTLPSITAAHIELTGGINATFDTLPEVEQFVRTGYLLHLAAGLKRDDTITAALARYTGLDPEFIARHHNRITDKLFMGEYERQNDRALSRYDATVSIAVPKPADHNRIDPLLDGIHDVLEPAMVQYAGQELHFRTDLPYMLLNRRLLQRWDYGDGQGYAGALSELQEARTLNPALRILIAHGYTDLVTPYAVSRYLIDQLKPIDGAVPMELRVYRGGHMMYTRAASRRELRKDAREMYGAALPQR